MSDRWWRGAVIYEVYPRSAADGNEDGIGDLIGLRHRLSVALSWLWVYVRDQRAARLITQGSSKVAR